MLLKRIVYSLLGICFLTSSAYAQQEHDTADPLTHAPIGVMGDHYHQKGEWMTSYRYMKMDMSEFYIGTKQITVDQVHNDFMVSPVKMRMEMHMVGLMYGLADEITVVAMLPYIVKDMEHRRRTDSRQFSTKSSGIGDIKLSGMFSLEKFLDKKLHLNFGVSLPTGSIHRKDETLLGKDRDLPYPMQLGSGTADLLPGFTFNHYGAKWSWGGQFLSTIRTGKNSLDYQLGNNYNVTAWAAYKWMDGLSTSGRINAAHWSNVRGADPRINPLMVPTADPDLQAGERIDLLFGINLVGQKGVLHDHRLALEFGFPVYQSLDGPQLGAGLQGTVGWQKVF